RGDRRGGRRRGTDDHLAARGVLLRRRSLGCGTGHLFGETPVQIGQEFLARGSVTLAGGAQLDRGADLSGLKVVGRERLWSPAPQQIVDVTMQPSRVHDWPPSLTCAASRSARC